MARGGEWHKHSSKAEGLSLVWGLAINWVEANIKKAWGVRIKELASMLDSKAADVVTVAYTRPAGMMFSWMTFSDLLQVSSHRLGGMASLFASEIDQGSLRDLSCYAGRTGRGRAVRLISVLS